MSFFYEKRFPVFSHGVTNSCGVLIAYVGKMSFIFNKQKTDKAGGILILNITIDTEQCILINLFNANTETEQVIILEELENLLTNFDISQNKRIIFAGYFNIFFNSKLEAKGGKPLLKRKSIAKISLNKINF